ncbi:ThuA domain-containing protein [Tessaracoccus antarcticus]|uniref:Glycosyl hydrolase n=1 Tax=Tessaracoccus antarcticus TaxID=2479848 RepID=A0A3M0GA00_9ACTN|nr:ThuA domain-containing protein [Tessaracoccus antarcticus]RMB61724.1 glycosyl hydrolase [Tessaracoccus antarcticus]
MPRILILSGAGHYADPWHPFAETSGIVAGLLREVGHDVVVRDSAPGSLQDLPQFDLLVVNSGGRLGEPDPAVTASWAVDHRALAAFHIDGGPILGLHTAVATFPDWPAWAAIIGGRWGEEAFHPEIDTATFLPSPQSSSHPVWDSLESVVAFDERYSRLELLAGSEPLVQHETDGTVHTMGWLASVRVVYDGLGHDARSYESAGRRCLLLNEVQWLLTPPPGAGH